MTDYDLPQFMACFTMLTRVFPFRGDEAEAQDISRAYFKTLRKYPLDLVKAGADNCVESMERFPKPAEWAKRIPRRPTGPEVPPLTPLEASEWGDAEKRYCEGDPCGCRACREAGVDDQAIRFVPDDPEERAMLNDQRVVLRGHWIHGDDLVRWYAARAKFWTGARKFFDTHEIKRVPPMLWKPQNEEREPGMEG